MTMKLVVLALAFLLPAAAAIELVPDRILEGGKGHAIPCSGDVVEFETSVLIDFDGFDEDPKDVTRIDWKGLETLFMDSYNALSNELCDDSFREILYVTSEREDDGNKIIKRGGCQFSVRFTVHVRCRGCYPDDAYLFSAPGHYVRALEAEEQATFEILDDFQDAIIGEDGTVTETGQRNLKAKKDGKGYYYYNKSSKKSSKKSGKGKGGKGSYYGPEYGKGKGGGNGYDRGNSRGDGYGKGGKGQYYGPEYGKGKGGGYDYDGGDSRGDGNGDRIDYCGCDSRFPEYRAPSEDEFRIVYDAAIGDFKYGYVPPRRGGVSVDFVSKVTETIELSCSEVVEEFSSLVSVEFYGSPTQITEDERTELEETFLQVYNGLQANRCDDPFFRDVVLTDVVMQADPEEANVFIYIFRVDGTCRGFGCGTNSTFFDEPFTFDFRRLDYENEQGRELHYDPKQGWDHSRPDTGCSCPLYATDSGAPTTDDFEVRLFTAMQCLKEKGLLPNVDASGEVIELPVDAPPSINITEAPSGMPSDFPTGEPSISVAPSRTPSVSPSEIPTDATDPPSGSPTAFDETPQPTVSPIPSETPSDTPTDTPSVSPTELADDTDPPTVSLAPSLSPTEPADDTDPPTLSSVPSLEPSGAPSVSSAPSISSEPTRLTEEPTISEAPSTNPTISSQPSISILPSQSPTFEGQELPTISPAPSLSSQPSVSASPSSDPTVSNQPSQSIAPSLPPTFEGQILPTVSPGPTTSPGPTVSEAPSTEPTVSSQPSTSISPSEIPTISLEPSLEPTPLESEAPSGGPTTTPQPSTSVSPSGEPTISNSPSTSAAPSEIPSSGPSISSEPTVSDQPSTGPTISDSPSISIAPSQEPSISEPPTVETDADGGTDTDTDTDAGTDTDTDTETDTTT